MPIYSYKDLIVWQKSLALSKEIYRVTGLFPKEEMYGLVSQMRRCAVSIPSNIAEGRSRGTRKDFAQFLRIAYGSGAELETQLEIAGQLEFIDKKDLNILKGVIDEIMRMLNVMIKKLKAKS